MSDLSVSEAHAEGIVGAGQNLCSHCGDLSWTVLRYGVRVHQETCPHREDDYSQEKPPPEATP